jgi:hypothetical protein
MNSMKFVSAYFKDNDRKHVLSYWEDPESPGDLVEIVIEADDTDSEWKELLTHIALDEIHTNTWNYIKDSEQALKDQVIDIAKDNGWLINMDDGGTSDFHKILVDMIFDPYDEEIHKEKLFFFKLQLFEKDFMKNSKDKEGKKKVRRAATPLDALKAAIEIHDANQ